MMQRNLKSESRFDFSPQPDAFLGVGILLKQKEQAILIAHSFAKYLFNNRVVYRAPWQLHIQAVVVFHRAL